MAVDMIHRLAPVGLAVDHKTGALFGAAQLRRQFLGLVEKPAQEGRLFRPKFHYIGDVFFGDHQKMHRRLGIQVVEGQEFPILVDLPGGDLTLDDFTKYAVAHGNTVALESFGGQKRGSNSQFKISKPERRR